MLSGGASESAFVTPTIDRGGRIELPDDVREAFGDEFRAVPLPGRVVLLPVDDDPLAGLRAAVGDAFEGRDRSELEAEALRTVDVHARRDPERPD